MKKTILLILGITILVSCQRIDDDDTIIDNLDLPEGVCDYKTAILSPQGFELNTISEIDFNGGVRAFQFVDEQTGFAMLGNNVGSYVEVFKTTDGGQTWYDLNIDINQFPRSMIFRDENFGIITVHDVTGCPSNCQNKCVILKTENGGLDWEEIEIEELRGKLYHPQFDTEGNLYATLSLLGEQPVIVKSTDKGENWDTLFSSPELDFRSITFSFKIFQDKIYASAKEGILVLDTDGQLTKVIDTEEETLWDLALIDEDNLVVAFSTKTIKSTNGGDTWETIHDQSARIIGFDSADKGLMLLRKSSCPMDNYQVNDLIASTNNGGLNWIDAEETTTNLRIHFSNSQKMDDGIWYFMIGNELMKIKEN